MVTTDRTGVRTWPFAFDPTYKWLLAGLGIRPGTAMVTTDDEGFEARFGMLRVRTPWSNVKGTMLTRDYTAIKAIGPRASLKDRGATFGTNTAAGLCLCFHEPVTGLAGRLVRHPGLTVTVADCEGLQAEVEARIAGN